MLFKSLDPALRKRLFIGLLLVLSTLLLLSAIRQVQGPPSIVKPVLGLMTTLPIQWSEGTLSSAIDSSAEPEAAYARLAEHYSISPVDDLKQLVVDKVEILMLAQSRAMAPAELVALDGWIRSGGKVLILADPALQWESSYPIGDTRRPLFTSMLSPLFGHWGLELVLPVGEAGSKTVLRRVGDMTIRTATPGEWLLRKNEPATSCSLSSGGLLATCRVGLGRVILVADADLIESDYWYGTGIRVMSGSDDFDNMRWIEKLLQSLRRDSGNNGEIMGESRKSMGE